MATKPTDLTNKTWDKVKALTLPKTGFGEKLKAYGLAKQKTENLATRNLKSFRDAAEALTEVKKHIPEVIKKCNKTLHKDTLEAMAVYKTLADKEGQELAARNTQYMGYVDRYKNLREVCGKEMTAIENALDQLLKDAQGKVRQLGDEGKVKAAAALVGDTLKKLKDLQDKADASIAKPRVPGPAAETPHADDRPDASVFTALINKQTAIIGARKQGEAELAAALKDAVEAAKKAAPDPKPVCLGITVKQGSTELGTCAKAVYDRAAKELLLAGFSWTTKLDPLRFLEAKVSVTGSFEKTDEDFKMDMQVAGIGNGHKNLRLAG